MNPDTFLDSFGHIADGPGGVDKLRHLVRDLAVRGCLTNRSSSDEPVEVLLKAIESERQQLVASSKVRKKATPAPIEQHELPFDAPAGWDWRRLGSLTYKLVDGSHNPPAGSAEGRPMLSARNISSGVLKFDGPARLLSEEAFAIEHRRTSVEPHDLLMCIVGTIGGTAVVPEGCEPFVLQRSVAVIRSGLLVGYLKIFMDSPVAIAYYETHARGSAQNGLYLGKLSLLPVIVPPLAEQRRIVTRVGELMTLCDELDGQQAARAEARTALTAATLGRIIDADAVEDPWTSLRSFTDNIGLHLAPGNGDIAALKRVRRTILDLAVRGRLTNQDPADEPAAELLDQIAAERDRLARAKEIRRTKRLATSGDVGGFDLPDGWARVRASEFFIASNSGWSPQCLVEPAGPGEWGVLKTSAVSRGRFDEAENKKLPEALEPRPHLEVGPGEFVMIRASGSKSLVGRGAIVTETESRLMLSDKHIRLSFMHEASTRFWAVLNESAAVQSYYSSESSGTSTMSNVTRDRIGALVVAVPPLSEQLRIAETVDMLFGLCDDLEQQFLAAENLRGDLTVSITAHAATG